MKKHISVFIILLIIFSIFPKDIYGNIVDSNYIDVKISNSRNISELITLSSNNGFNLYEKSDKGSEIYNISDNSIIISTNMEGSINILNSFNEIITTIPGDGSIVIGSGDKFDSKVQVEKNKYRDYITFMIKGDKINIINHIDVEHYLYGVVPREIPASSQLEALKAQAVVARSFAYANINKHINEGFNLCDTTHCQVYGGYDNEHPSTNQAVIETYGDYVTYNGSIISALYHSNSGGYTEASVDVWGGNSPYLTAVEDRFSINSPNSTWSIKMSPREIEDKLIASNIFVGSLIDIKVLEVSDANRVLSLKVIGSSSEKDLKGTQLRTIFGATLLKSTWFTINKEGGDSNTKVYVMDGNGGSPSEVNLKNAHIIDGKNKITVSRSEVSRAMSSNRTSTIGQLFTSTPDAFVIDGKGYGHGVGMSQYGAMEMAKQGYNYEEIITHYYKGVEITNSGK